MPVLVDPAALGAYARFPGELDQDWVERTCHLSPADLDLVRRRADQVTRLGFAVQVVTVRAIGTFLPDPAAVPARVATAVARQLDAADARVLAGYRDLAVRWRHTAEIRTRYGYRDFTAQPGHFLLLAWLYRQAWADDVAPSVLFRAAHRRLLGEQILLPGQSVLARLVAAVRDRAARRLHTRLLVAAPAEMRARLEKLLIVPGGSRRSELDRLRRPPFSPTISGLVNALERLADVRALGAGDLDLSGLPAPRVAALARYADQAWATQLADLGPERRVATLLAYTHVLAGSARDDVLDIFDVVFGDLQRAATHRGQKRRTSELRDYDRAVAELHTRMQALLDGLDDPAALPGVLDGLRAERAGIDAAMDTVAALMRPPADPFHERLVAAYPQIRRFLPALINAVDLQATESARPVLAAYHALGDWLSDKPRTTHRPAQDLPLEVVTPSWAPHVHDRDDDTVNRAAYACCVLDALRTRLRRRDIYAPASTRWGDPRAELLTAPVWEKQRDTLCDELALNPDATTVVDQLAASLDQAWRRTADGLPGNPDLRIEHRGGRDEIVATPLEAQGEPASLVALRSAVERLLPEVEIADLPLEVHGWTGFLDEYTHMAGTGRARHPGLAETLSALLVSESCNVGLTPVTDDNHPPLTRERLNWVAHNYLRSATHAAANTRLVDHHTRLPLPQTWGGGEMASADGMRFVIPVSTIHAAYNPRYFGRQRGSTLYSWMADTHAVFAQTLIPGTQRDSLHALDGLLANPTTITPKTVSTDTAGASEIVFALGWVLGYRWAPRLADLPDQRLWRIDPHAGYGPLVLQG